MANILKNLNIDKALVMRKKDGYKSARNIPGIKTTSVNTLNVYDILKYDKFIITKDAVQKVEEVYV